MYVAVKINELLDSSTVYIQMAVGLYNTFKTIVSPTNLCQLPISSTSSSVSSSSCPQVGEYLLKTAFYLSTLLDDANKDLHFTPDLNITFTDTEYNRIGCARTGIAAMHRHAKQRRIIGMWSLGVALVIFAAVFGGLLVLAHRRRKRLEKLSEKKVPKYQYFRTLPNGQVIPIQQHGTPATMMMPPQIIPPIPPPPHHHQPGIYGPMMPPGAGGGAIPLQQHPSNYGPNMMIPAQGGGGGPSPREAYSQISNPAYNETQLPTRPVI
jgi:hypothetical protein